MADIRTRLIEEMTPDERFRRVVEILTAASVRLLKKQKEARSRESRTNQNSLDCGRERR